MLPPMITGWPTARYSSGMAGLPGPKARVALLSNIVFKSGLASFISGPALAKRVLPDMAAFAAGLCLAWWLGS
jgi:hypothetical protein